MYTQEMLIGIAAACAIGGILLGLIAGRYLLRSKHAATLERELNEAQDAMKEYKAEVFSQFGDTAKKFEKLNESYADLHKQLATSASVLLADMPDVPLLAGSSTPSLDQDIEGTADVEATTIDAEESVVEEPAPEEPEPQPNADSSSDASQDTGATDNRTEEKPPKT